MKHLMQKFLEKVAKTDSCWIWTGTITADGYGQIYVNGKEQYAHRISHLLFYGEINSGLVIDHSCRRRDCVNPDHLSAMTNKENVLKGTGISANNAKKTECVNGHLFTSDNTALEYRSYGVSRKCKTCRRQSAMRYYYRRLRCGSNAHPSSSLGTYDSSSN